MSSAIIFVIAILSGLGVGSGGLLVIYLTLVEKVPQLTAQGTNLIFFILASLSSLLFTFTKRRIPFGAVVIMGVLGICGSLIGTHLTAVLQPDTIKKLFGFMLIGSGIYTLAKK